LNGHFSRYRIDLAGGYLILNQGDEAIEQPEHARAGDLTEKAIYLRSAITCCRQRDPKKVREMWRWQRGQRRTAEGQFIEEWGWHSLLKTGCASSKSTKLENT
jgi:hypothetical protein